MKRALQPVPLFVRETGWIFVRTHDDVAHHITSDHAARLDHATLVSGPPAFGARNVSAEGSTEVPAHVSAPRKEVECVAARPELDVLD